MRIYPLKQRSESRVKQSFIYSTWESDSLGERRSPFRSDKDGKRFGASKY